MDLEAICRRVVIIDRGRKLFDGGLGEMKDRFARTRAIRFSVETALPDVALEGLRALPGVSRVIAEDGRLTLRFDRFLQSAGALTRQVMQQTSVSDFQIEEPAIEDVIRQLYSGELRGEPAP
jgi:ABC-2 type transport system ATP-binding protein